MDPYQGKIRDKRHKGEVIDKLIELYYRTLHPDDYFLIFKLYFEEQLKDLDIQDLEWRLEDLLSQPNVTIYTTTVAEKVNVEESKCN